MAVLWSSLYVLVGGPYGTTFTTTAVLALMQVGFLCTPPVLAYVFGKDSTPAH